MSLSTTLTFNTLPTSVQRPELHDGKSRPDELIKLTNQMRDTLNETYHTAFDFTTPGDGAPHVAWQAQLDDADTWFAIAQVVATSAAGDGATWRRQALITRNGATVTVVSDVNVTNVSTGSLAAFAVSWGVSSLNAQLKLTDAVGTVGFWRVSLEVIRP